MSIVTPTTNLHDSAVSQIARTMFSFANGEVYPGLINPTWGTYTNVGEKRMPVHHRWEGTLWPDIVMVDTAKDNSPRLIVEVETEDTINEVILDRVWKLDMDECPIFYLFVPAGTATKTAELLLKFRGMCKVPRALYTYEFDDLYNVVVTPV
jgi:hypothetical protein